MYRKSFGVFFVWIFTFYKETITMKLDKLYEVIYERTG